MTKTADGLFIFQQRIVCYNIQQRIFCYNIPRLLNVTKTQNAKKKKLILLKHLSN